MAGPYYIADAAALSSVALDGLSVLFHAPSGMTHIVAPPAPEILEALAEGPADPEEILRRLAKGFDFEPSPLMGEGRVGVNASTLPAGLESSPHPRPLPIKGRGADLDALRARLAELEAAGLVRRA